MGPPYFLGNILANLIIWFSNMQNFRRDTARANTLIADEEPSERGKDNEKKRLKACTRIKSRIKFT